MYECLQELKCVVVKPHEMPDSYEVLIKEDNVAATLISTFPLSDGEEIVALYVCFNEGRILLSLHIEELRKRRR